MERKIPNIMGTQHPDNVNTPFFKKHKNPFMSAYREIREAYQNFYRLDVDEYMWDWEGKNADSSVINRLYSEHYDYFKNHPLGKNKFLTFRFPNIWEEQGYSLMQAMTTMLIAEDFAYDLKFKQRPLFEAILPMTQSAKQLVTMQDKYASLAHFKNKEFKVSHINNDNLEMIPLFESFSAQINSPKILEEFINLYKKHFHKNLSYIRVFLAGSDSALSNGLLNSMIGNKITLSRLGKFSKKFDLPIYPIAGMGSSIFRGGLSPIMVDRYLKEFPGLKTVTIQSAFRYDYPLEVVKKSIVKLRKGLQKSNFNYISDKDEAILLSVAKKASQNYHRTLDPLIEDLQPIFDSFPTRRDRHLHIGILGYSRHVDGYKMPRAIPFTGTLYSLGVPPEFIGAGKVLRQLNAQEFNTLLKYYPDIKKDYSHVARFVSSTALKKLQAKNPKWIEVKKDIIAIKDLFKIKIGPQNENEVEHSRLATDLTQISDPQTQTSLIERMGSLRRFLG